MSLNHSLKQTLQHQWRPNLQLSPSIAMFYLLNPNANEEEIEKFAENNKIERQMVSKYFNARKNQEKVNFNMLSMKNGLKYTKPEPEQIEEYDNKISSAKNTESDIMDIIPENIPKKTRRPEFQVINDERQDTSAFSFSNTSDNSSSFSYSSLQNYDDPKQITNLISSLKKANKMDARLHYSQTLKSIESTASLNRFVQLNGYQILGSWIDSYKEEIESNSSVNPRVYDIITNLLNFCEKLPITVHDLKISKIGKKVNKLGKCVSDRIIKTKCEILVSRWKKLIENIKDKKKDNGGDHAPRKRSNSPKSPKGKDSHQSDYHSLNKKTKRDRGSKDYPKDEVSDKSNKKSRYEDKESTTLTSTSPQTNLNVQNAISQNTPTSQPTNTAPKRNVNTTMTYQQNTSVHSTPNQTIATSKKGILKKISVKKGEKRIRVRWEAESKMEKVKIFKMYDEPEAPAITDEEYHKIQLEVLNNPNYKYQTDMRSKEINMEKENMSKAREKSKLAKDILFRMVPQMSWKRPFEIKISQPHDEDCTPLIEGSESEEKLIIDSLCQKILRVIYFRDSEIPEAPTMGGSQLFSFTDEFIPKIENMMKPYNPEKPNPNAEILEYIEHNYEATPSTEFVKNLIQKLQNKEFSPEESMKISEYLNKHLSVSAIKKDQPSQMKPLPTMPTNFPANFNPPLNMNMNYNFNSSVNMPSMPLTNPLNNNLNQGAMMGQMQGQNMQNNQHEKKFYNKHPNFNNEAKPLPSKFKTRPCRNFHGPIGCSRGNFCHFIHDPNYAGREIPDFNLQNYNRNTPTNGNSSVDKKVMITNVNIVNNYASNEGERQENADERVNDTNENLAQSNNANSTNATSNNNHINYPMQQGYNRTPYIMGNMNPNGHRPPFMNVNPQFINQNPYMYMNFMRAQMQMNSNQQGHQNQVQNKVSGQGNQLDFANK